MTILENTRKIRVETENDATELINKYRKEAEEKNYLVKKAIYERKDKKAKGEIVDTCFVVTIVQVFNTLWEV